MKEASKKTTDCHQNLMRVPDLGIQITTAYINYKKNLSNIPVWYIYYKLPSFHIWLVIRRVTKSKAPVVMVDSEFDELLILRRSMEVKAEKNYSSFDTVWLSLVSHIDRYWTVK